MGGTDAAGGENIGVASPQRIDRPHDRTLLVADDSHLLEVDAERGQVFGDIADVPVLGPARQDLVADDQQRRRDETIRLAHAAPVRPPTLLGTNLSHSRVGKSVIAIILGTGDCSLRPAYPIAILPPETLGLQAQGLVGPAWHSSDQSPPI